MAYYCPLCDEYIETSDSDVIPDSWRTFKKDRSRALRRRRTFLALRRKRRS